VPSAASAQLTTKGIALSWTASTDTVGTPKYEVLRNDRVIAGAYGTTSYTDPYGSSEDRYFVRAVDAAGNRSASTPVLAPKDAAAPTVPTGLAASLAGNEVTLTWSASSDNTGVAGYAVFRNGVAVGDVAGTTTTVTGLAAGSHAFQVLAFDAAGNRSSKTASVTVTVAGADTTAPTVPRDLAATVTGSDATLTWTASTDAVGVTGYAVFRNGTAVGDVTGTTTTVSGLAAGTHYFQVLAFDAAGNRSAKTASATAQVVGPDTAAPTVPKNLAATVAGRDVTLTWSASTDSVGVVGYTLFRNGVVLGDVTATTATVTGLAAGNHSFQVLAFDAAGNRSAKTAPLSVAVSP